MKFINQMAEAFADELQKIAMAAPAKPGIAGPAALMGAGALGWEALRRAHEDRKMGKQIRMQSQGGLF